MFTRNQSLMGIVALAFVGSAAFAQVVHDYESLAEGFHGLTLAHNGVTYRDVNNVSGAYPEGEPFDPNEPGGQVIIENATFFYVDFPTYGSPNNVMTFGRAFIPGDNLSIGALASVWMDLDELASEASFDIGFYENGPWGGIEYRLDAVLNDQVVDSDTYVLSNLGGRDNATFQTLRVSAPAFDSLHLYGWLNGGYTVPRGMIDNLTIVPAGEPCVGDLNNDGAVGLTDLALLLANFGTPAGATLEQGDIDGDGDVDLTDLAELLANFGTVC